MLIKERWYEEIGPHMHCHTCSFILTGAISSVDLLATCGCYAAQSCITYTYFLNIMVATHSLVPRPSHTAFFRSHGKKVCQAFPQLFYSRAKKMCTFFFLRLRKKPVWEGLAHFFFHGCKKCSVGRPGYETKPHNHAWVYILYTYAGWLYSAY